MQRQQVKRSQRAVPPVRKPEPKPPWPLERHSGEGAASALEMLQKLEKRRVAGQPAEPPSSDDSEARH
jgi:hypothetical protein